LGGKRKEREKGRGRGGGREIKKKLGGEKFRKKETNQGPPAW